MVAASIIALAGYGVTTMVANFSQETIMYATQQELEVVKDAAQAILQDNVQCAYALRDAAGTANSIVFTGATTNIDSIYSVNTALVGKLYLKSNTQFSPRLGIGQITIEESQAGKGRTTEIVNGISYNTYLANVVIPAKNNVKNTTMPPKSIPIKVYTTSPANKIQLCSTSALNTQSCITIGGTFDPATGNCILPPCPRVPPSVPAVDSDCLPLLGPPPNLVTLWTGCGPSYYFWTFGSGGTAGTQTPKCVCRNYCMNPPAPAPPVAAPQGPQPVFTY
jgi:hypothetical protein